MEKKFEYENSYAIAGTNFWNYLDDYLKEQQINQSEFCRRHGLAQSWLNRKMNGKPYNIGLKTICSIANMIDVPYIEMLTYNRNEKKI